MSVERATELLVTLRGAAPERFTLQNAAGLAAWCGSPEDWRAAAAAHALLDLRWPAEQALAEAWAQDSISDALDPLDEEGLRSIRDVTFRALCLRLPKHWRTRWLVRHEALRPGGAITAIDVLLEHDADWLAANASAIVEATPEVREPVELELAAQGHALNDSADIERAFDLPRVRREPSAEVRRRLLRAARASIGVDDLRGRALHRQLLREGAALGDTDAAADLAWIAMTGADGEAHPQMALQLLHFAAERGNASASFTLGRLQVDVDESREEGWRRIRSAATAGDPEAVRFLESGGASHDHG